MDWSGFWSDVSLWTTVQSYTAILAFVMIFFAGFAVIITPFLVDYVIREMGGLKGLLGRLCWCVGLSFALSGAMGLVLSIVTSLVMLAISGSVVGGSPSTQLASLVGSALFGLLGGSLVWLLWRWRPFEPQPKPTRKVVAQRWAEVTRWGIQLFHGFAITLLIAIFLSVVVTLPEWLAWLTKKDRGDPTPLLTAVVVGTMWATADYIWRKVRAKRDQAAAEAIAKEDETA